MKKLLASIAALMLATSTAQATEAEWFRNQQWIVIGSTEGYCAASAIFTDIRLSIGITADKQFRFGIEGVAATRGEQHFTVIRTGPSTILLRGESFEDKSVSYPVGLDTVIKMAYAKTLRIDKVGNFDMTGSMEAITETMKCRDVMNGVDI